MAAERTDSSVVAGLAGKSSFFRQSGWLLLAATASGVFMWAVHKVAGKMPKAEYGVFVTLLQALNMMAIPAMGLQMVFVQQTVSAATDTARRELVGAVRSVSLALFGLWLLMAAVIFAFRQNILTAYEIANPAALWMTVGVGLLAVCTPVLLGMLQGKMNFFWLGWAFLANGVGRLVMVAIAVLVFGGAAAGAMTGVLLATFGGLGIALWHTRDLWRGPALPMQWTPWLKRVLPLTLGYGAATAMLSMDMIVVGRFFPGEEKGFYGAAGIIGRALVFLTAPLTAVMFPRVVQSAARAEKTDVLAQALGATGLLGVAAAIGCTLFPELPLRIVYDKSYLAISPLIPWFAWCMLPLTLANVLVNNLLARERFGVVAWLVIIAAAYGITLWNYHPSFLAVVKTLGVFAFLFLTASLLFTWFTGTKRPSNLEKTAERPT